MLHCFAHYNNSDWGPRKSAVSRTPNYHNRAKKSLGTWYWVQIPLFFSQQGRGIERRFLKKEHLEKYKSWLVYSPSKEGLFCKVCPFFAPALKGGHHGGMKLNTLVTQPLTKFSKLLGKDGDLESLKKTQYHQQALDCANDFLVTHKNPEKSIENQVDTYRMKRAK